jgi:polyisoprenyl-teichoic acid--peptidoglycan teichoic acid transferase
MTVPRTRRAPLVALLVVGLLVGLLAGAVVAAVTVQHRADVRPAYGKDGILTILVIGSDVGWPTRPGDELRGNADALHLLAIDTAARRVTLLDFPRDALVGGRKVNGHLARGGPDLLVSQMEAFTGLPIDHWALTTFHGLERMTAELGGIGIVVERPMTNTGTHITIPAGPQVLGPHEALGFVRDRKSQPRGDFDRTRNQGLLLRSVHDQVRADRSDLVALTRLSASFVRDTHSSIPRAEVIRLALLAVQIDPDDVLQVPLGGSIGTGAGGASIVRLAPGDAFDRIRAGQVGP